MKILDLFSPKVSITREQYQAIVFVRRYFAECDTVYCSAPTITKEDAGVALIHLPLYFHSYCYMAPEELPAFRIVEPLEELPTEVLETLVISKQK